MLNEVKMRGLGVALATVARHEKAADEIDEVSGTGALWLVLDSRRIQSNHRIIKSSKDRSKLASRLDRAQNQIQLLALGGGGGGGIVNQSGTALDVVVRADAAVE